MKNKKGFTLIEILIVIGIIGLLAVFLMPSFVGVQDKAKDAAVKKNAEKVQLSVESYNLENETHPIATNISLKTLFDDYLSTGGYMTTIPKNPYTGKAYEDADSAGKIVYNFDSTTNTYTIKGYKRNGSTKIIELTNMQ